MEKQRIYFGYIEGDVLRAANNLVEYLKEDEMGDFIFCDEEKQENHIFNDIERIENWLKEIPVLSRFCWRLSIGLYAGLFFLMLGHLAWHLGFFDNIFFR